MKNSKIALLGYLANKKINFLIKNKDDQRLYFCGYKNKFTVLEHSRAIENIAIIWEETLKIILIGIEMEKNTENVVYWNEYK